MLILDLQIHTRNLNYFFRAGYKLTVIDAVSDKDWWKGKCFGAVGVFPSNYVTQLHPGEKPLQVTQTVQINATSMQEPPIKLLRDQVLTFSLTVSLSSLIKTFLNVFN